MTLTIIYSALPHYRQPILDLLQRLTDDRLEIYCGDQQFDPTLVTDITARCGPHRVRNHYLLNRRILWQSGVLAAGIRAENLIVEINPRIVNVWATLACRRLLRRPTVAWGHAWSKRGSGSGADRLRNAQRSLADALVVYTSTQQRELASRMTNRPILAAPNSLYPACVAGPTPSTVPGHTFVFCARLVSMKKPLLLLEAFALAQPRLGPTATLTIVGDGPMRPEIEQRAHKLGIVDAIRFRGHVTAPDDLRSVYADAVASVSPGAVGLSVTQSLWFGVPMIVATKEPHGPELEAAIDGDTALFFDSDDAAALADRLIAAWNVRDRWVERRGELSRRCRETYSAEVMAERLLASTAAARAHARTNRQAGHVARHAVSRDIQQHEETSHS